MPPGRPGVPVVLAFTLHGAKRFQEWRNRCKKLGVTLYQRDDLIVAEQDSVIEEIADMLRRLTGLEYKRKKTVCVASAPRDGVRRVMGGFLSSLGLIPVHFDQRTSWTSGASPPAEQELKAIFRETQAFIVVLTPDWKVVPVDSSTQPGVQEPEVCFQPDSRVILAAGMAHVIDPQRVIAIRIGDIGHSNALYERSIRLDDTPETQNAVIARLKDVGCRVDGGAIGLKAGFGAALCEGRPEDG